jgi:zinc protease
MTPTNDILRQLGVSFVAEQAGISEYRLDANSLKILLAPDPASRVVAVVQHVNVGSRHEGAGNTGYSHLLEHMLFKGTPTHPLGSGHSYDEFMKPLGGDYNATTTTDRTNYFAKIPSSYLGAYLAYEADRLRNAIITDEDLATEMPVVVDEFDIGENNPDELLEKRLNATMFTEHSYKIDTIGSRSEVMKVTAAQLRERLYEVYYHPNNTTLILVGGFDTVEALKLIVQHYGAIPPSAHPIPVPYTVEPPQFGEQRFVINKPGDLPRVVMGFHVPEARHADTLAIQALATVLGGTEASRLHRKLVDSGLCAKAYAYSRPSHDPGVFKVAALLNPGTKPEKVERIILREIERLKSRLIPKTELRRIKVLNRAGTVHLRADKMRFATNLSEHEAVADWRWGEDYDDGFDAVTRERIVEVATRYLHADNRTVGYFLPKEAPAEAGTEGDSGSVVVNNGSQTKSSSAPAQSPNDNTGAVSFAHSVQKVVLPNGLTLLLQPTQAEGAVGVSLMTRAGSSYAPADKRITARMVAMMLTEGSKKYSKKRIAELTSEMLVDLSFQPNVFEVGLATHVVPGDLPRFLDLLGDVVRNPLFPRAELDVTKTKLQAHLEAETQNPTARASVALSQAFYAPGSAHYALSAKERAKQVAAVTVEDLRAFHSRFYSPKGTVLTVVGKFDAAAIRKTIEAKFGSWSGEDVPAPAPSAINEVAADGRNVRIHIDGKDNLSILVGAPSELTYTSPDYVAALLANIALGGGSLYSRLNYEIREKRGLTYGVYSQFVEAGVPGGLWLVKMTTNGAKVGQAVPLIFEVVRNFVAGGIGEQELEAEREGLINQFALSLDTPVNVANRLTSAELSGQGVASLDTFESRVRALTKEQVDEAIRKFIPVEKAVTVVAGTLPTA